MGSEYDYLSKVGNMGSELQGMLSPYRILDLTDEKGLLCGKILGDLGADVIKVERPGGDPARNIGPFYHDEHDPQKSLFWFAYNTNKRGITLNIEKPEGQDIFKMLVKGSDFVIESFSPGYMDELGLGYTELEKLNPGIILVAITPFGRSGPYRDYKTSDAISWAMGGQTYLWGDIDRPPVRISHHGHAYLLAGSQAAVGALMALYWRGTTGRGQRVDISIHETVSYISLKNTIGWPMTRTITQRDPIARQTTNSKVTWSCKDGWVTFGFTGTATAPRSLQGLVKWMEEEGVSSELIKSFDWSSLNLQTITEEVISRLVEPTEEFFKSHTKLEILRGAIKHRVLVYPMATTKDILESEQLSARNFWVNLDHPALGESIAYPGAFLRSSTLSQRAPLAGEHNRDIYQGEMGLSSERLDSLIQANVI
jgi:benzylsuccinate CoA-transferase BbsE subunit